MDYREDWKQRLDVVAKNINQSVVNLQSKESAMNNPTKVVKTVKDNVNTFVNAGKQAASNPRLIGEKLAETVNNMGDKKDALKDAFKLGFSMLVEGAKDIKKGYDATRKKEIVEDKQVDKTSI